MRVRSGGGRNGLSAFEQWLSFADSLVAAVPAQALYFQQAKMDRRLH